MFFMLLACSLGNYSQLPCSDSIECSSAFGLGSYCSESGFCEDLTLIDRCTTTIPPDLFDNLDEHRDDLLIGMLFDFYSDEAMIAAVEMVINDVNGAGLDGKSFALVECDYQDDSDGIIYGISDQSPVEDPTSFLIEKLSAPVIIGPAGSNDSLLSYPFAEKLNSVLISPSASSPELTSIDASHQKNDADPGLFWRMVGSDEIQAAVLSHQIHMNEETSLSLIYQKGSYGKNFINELLQNLDPIVRSSTNSFEFSSMETLQLIINDPNVHTNRSAVVFISAEIFEITHFLKEIAPNVNFADLNLYLADAAADEELLAMNISSDKIPHIFGTRPALPSGNVFDLFRDDYNISTNFDAANNVYAAYTFDATWFALYGYAWAHYNEKEYRGSDIARGLRQLSDLTGPNIDMGIQWAEGMSHLSSGKSINVTGASGELDFDPLTEEIFNPIEIFRLGKHNNERCFVITHLCNYDQTLDKVTCMPQDNDSECQLE